MPFAASLAISRVATSAVTALGLTGSPRLVDDEAAVGVAVEREPDVGAVLDDRLLQVAQVLGLEGVRLVVRERAVELEVQRDHIERERVQAGAGAEDGGRGEAAHAVARVDDHLQGPVLAEVDERAEEAGVVREGVALRDGPGGALRGRRTCRTVEGRLRQVADLGQTAVLSDGPRA